MNSPVLSFNSGILSPKIDARSDVEKYSSGCKALDGFIPTIYGCAERVPGTKRITRQYGANGNPVKLVSFIFNSTTSYMLEFGDLYIRPMEYVEYEGERVYYEGDEVFDIWTPITTTYAEADLFELQFKQIGDVMWIVHDGYTQAKLTRTSTTSFSLDDILFEKGPFLIRNYLVNPFITDTAYMKCASATVLSRDTGDDTSNVIYGSGASCSWQGCAFKATTYCTITTIQLKLSSTLTPTGDITVSLRHAT